jgi:two-component system chemotaxis response regulator CheY
LFKHLKTLADASKTTLEPKEPRLEPGASIEVTHIALLRLLGSKGSGAFGLGYTDPNFPKILAEAFPPKTDAPPGSKTFEFELMKALYPVLEAETKALGYTVDPKATIIQEGTGLGSWKKIQVEQVIKMPFVTKAGELVFDMPVFDSAFLAEKTLEFYGFPEKTRVLVVDDSLASRKYSRHYLAMAGYFNVDECPDGQSALTKLVGSHPPFGLVVADWHMPNMSGLDLLKNIRATEEIRALPVILATGEKNKEEIINALKSGVTGYLVKPIEPASFMASLKKAADAIKK